MTLCRGGVEWATGRELCVLARVIMCGAAGSRTGRLVAALPGVVVVGLAGGGSGSAGGDCLRWLAALVLGDRWAGSVPAGQGLCPGRFPARPRERAACCRGRLWRA